MIRNGEGEETTPSVVYFESESNYVVGKEAKNGAVIYHDSTVSLIKREMGTVSERVFFGKSYQPETISSLILTELVEAARDATGIDTHKVVITVPAYFGLTEKEATRQAGRLAGLDVVGIVTEPVAAALSAGIKGDETKCLFIYDLGGGTFDCTVMEVGPNKIEVIVIDGNRRLGGADWDGRLFDFVVEKFLVQAGLDDDPTNDEDFSQRLPAPALAERDGSIPLRLHVRYTLRSSRKSATGVWIVTSYVGVLRSGGTRVSRCVLPIRLDEARGRAQTHSHADDRACISLAGRSACGTRSPEPEEHHTRSKPRGPASMAPSPIPESTVQQTSSPAQIVVALSSVRVTRANNVPLPGSLQLGRAEPRCSALTRLFRCPQTRQGSQDAAGSLRKLYLLCTHV